MIKKDGVINMKLKYYMRGLGIGILITTIVLSIGGKKEGLSDEEIMAKAKDLGMVMREDTDDKLEEVMGNLSAKDDKDMQDTNDTSNNTEKDVASLPNEESTTVEYEAEGADTDVIETSEEESATGATESSEKESDTGVTEPSDNETDTDVSELSNEESDTGTSDSSDENTDNVTFTIVRGMSSGQVSELLMQEGLIDDAEDFDNFIIRNGKASVIRIGTYTLPKDSDYEMILEAITKK